MKIKFSGFSEQTKIDIREAVELAVEYWPNAHRGTYEPREDIRSAFHMIRSCATADREQSIHAGVCALRMDAYSHEDM